MTDQAFEAVNLNNDNAMLALGREIEDRVSKMRGICVHVAYRLNGSVAVSIQPPSDGSECKGANMFDAVRCAIVGEGIGHIVPPKEPKFPLGVQLEDVITGIKGTATEYVYHVNGCITYQLRGKVELTNFGSRAPEHDIEQDQIKEVEGKKKAPVVKTGTGCSPIPR